MVWILTSLFPKRWRTAGKTCIAAAIVYSGVLLFFIFMLSPGTPAHSSARETTPPAAKENSSRAATPSDPGRTQAAAPAPTGTNLYHPYFVPNVQQSDPSAANELFAQARLSCIAMGAEITTNGTTIKCNAPKAISLYRRGLLLDPGNARAHKKLGDLLNWTDEYEAAKQEYQYALSLEPSNLYYMLDVGGELHKLGRHWEGDRMLERATRLAKNDDGEFLLALAQTREELGDIAGALPYYQRACKLGVADACTQEVFAQSHLQDLEHPAKSPAKAPPQNCCDCAPELTNMQCFQKCNAMIPRCGP